MTITVNGVEVDGEGYPSPGAAAAHELLRQRAVALGLAAVGATDEEIDTAIERLLEREVTTPEPTNAECRRFYDAHPEQFRSGELAFARHILFEVRPGAPVPAIRAKAELTLAELVRDPGRFGQCAREMSNCPTSEHGGNLGQVQRGETVPEFEHALFNGTYTGVYPQLVKTRYGFHIVAVDRREPGRQIPYEAVRGQIAERLHGRVQSRALRQYVKLLAGQGDVRGVNLDAADSPLLR